MQPVDDLGNGLLDEQAADRAPQAEQVAAFACAQVAPSSLARSAQGDEKTCPFVTLQAADAPLRSRTPALGQEMTGDLLDIVEEDLFQDTQTGPRHGS